MNGTRRTISGRCLLTLSLLLPCCSCRTVETEKPTDIQACANAAMDADLKLVKACLRAGVKANDKTSDGNSFLKWAVSSENAGRVAVVATLLDAGADPNQADDEGDTPLLKAASRGCEQCIAALLQHGAVADNRGPGGATALMVAANNWVGPQQRDWGLLPEIDETTFARIANHLLKAGANVNLHSPGQLSVLALAVATGKEQMTRLLLQAGARVNDADHNGTTPLMLASARGDVPVVEELIKAGADVNSRDRRGTSVLEEAMLMGNLETAALLRQAGAKAPEQCSSPPDPSRLVGVLQYYLCGAQARVAYTGDLEQKEMEFVIAGIPQNCTSIRNLHTGKPERGRLLRQVVVLRRTAAGWTREFSEDYFAKNSKYLLSWLIPDAPRQARLLPSGKNYGASVTFSFVEGCAADGSGGATWNPQAQRFQDTDENQEFVPELREAR